MSRLPATGIIIALHEQLAAGHLLALSAAVMVPEELPDWIHLLPAGTIATQDGRGPYTIDTASALIARTRQIAGEKLPIDENHSTDLAAPAGRPSPARGWIVQLEARADGIWGKVEWTPAGKQLLAERAYRGISPVFAHREDNSVIALLRAALTNVPNIRGLTALHTQETMMDLIAKLRAALGLDKNADESAVLAAVEAAKTTHAQQLASIAKAAGAKDGADAAAIVTAIEGISAKISAHATDLGKVAVAAGLDGKADVAGIVSAVTTLKAGAGDANTIVALQAEVKDLGTKLKTVQDGTARGAAEAAVDAAIRLGKPGVKAMRDHYIARHMADAAAVQKEFDALPNLTAPSGAQATPPTKDKDGNVVLNAEQSLIAKQLGIKPEDMAKTIATEQAANA